MNNNHIYCIGIGGVGMAWIVDYCLKNGYTVSGSDIQESALTKRLEQGGANIHYGASPEKIPVDVTEVVINSAITPHSKSFPELEEVKRRGLPVKKRAEWIGKLTRQRFTIAVSGTHGKTTTTALLGWILDKAGLDPTVFVGGAVSAWDNATKIGSSKYLVIEADEFDRSFHQFSADMAIILNIDPDHLDYYTGGIEEIEHSFRRFLRNLPYKKGLIVGYGKDKHIRKVVQGFSHAVRWYDESHIWPGISLKQPGTHNLLNATAAARIAHELGVGQDVIKDALASFPGVARRFEYLGGWNKCEVYDDYAHHPREIAATLQASREKFPNERVIAVFQPHQKSRTYNLLSDFGRCFDKNSPDVLILAPIFEVEGREEDITISSGDIAEKIREKNMENVEIIVPETNEELHQLTEAYSKRAGILLSMGAGNISQMIRVWMQ